MRIIITKKINTCPAPAIGTVHDVIETDMQLPEFIPEYGKYRYHINHHGCDTVVCEKECRLVK